MLPSLRSLINSLDLNEISVLNVLMDLCGMKIPGLVFLLDFLTVLQLLQENVLFVRQGLLQMLKASVFWIIVLFQMFSMVGNVIDVRKNQECSSFISWQLIQDNVLQTQHVLAPRISTLINLYAEPQDSHHVLHMNLKIRRTSINALLVNTPLKVATLVPKMLQTMWSVLLVIQVYNYHPQVRSAINVLSINFKPLILETKRSV